MYEDIRMIDTKVVYTVRSTKTEGVSWKYKR